MNRKELEKIERLDFDETTSEPLLDIGYRRHRLYRNDKLDFQIGISCTGIEAKKNVSLDDLIVIRDWINEVVKVSGRGDPAATLIETLARMTTPVDGVTDDEKREDILSDHPSDDAFEDACALYRLIEEARKIVAAKGGE